MRVFHTVQQDQQWRLPFSLCGSENIVRLRIGFGSDHTHHPLVVTGRNQAIQCSPRFHSHRHTLIPGQTRDFPELSVGSQHEETLDRTNPGAKRFAHGVEAVDHLQRVIVSIDWCHPAGPQS